MKTAFFPESFLSILVVSALIGISIAVVVLLVLLIKDIKSDKLW